MSKPIRSLRAGVTDKLSSRRRARPTCKFKSGDTVIWTPEGFSDAWWKDLSEEDRVKYYGVLGYGRPKQKPHLYTFLCEHRQQPGHCVLISMEDQHIETMRHTDEFRLATDDET